VGVSDRELLRNVREDVGRQRYHIACNRVFETTHKNELKKVRILHEKQSSKAKFVFRFFTDYWEKKGQRRKPLER
jgi:hypothetical protein